VSSWPMEHGPRTTLTSNATKDPRMKIETDVPLPESSRARKYPFLEMDVGESVYFDGEEVNGRAYRAAMSTGSTLRHNQKYVALTAVDNHLDLRTNGLKNLEWRPSNE
jgi:hypothetical protein